MSLHPYGNVIVTTVTVDGDLHFAKTVDESFCGLDIKQARRTMVDKPARLLEGEDVCYPCQRRWYDSQATA